MKASLPSLPAEEDEGPRRSQLMDEEFQRETELALTARADRWNLLPRLQDVELRWENTPPLRTRCCLVGFLINGARAAFKSLVKKQRVASLLYKKRQIIVSTTKSLSCLLCGCIIQWTIRSFNKTNVNLYLSAVWGKSGSKLAFSPLES